MGPYSCDNVVTQAFLSVDECFDLRVQSLVVAL